MSVSAIGPEKSREIKSVTNIYSQGGAPTAKKIDFAAKNSS